MDLYMNVDGNMCAKHVETDGSAEERIERRNTAKQCDESARKDRDDRRS